jgi:hypothetical protein
VNHIETVGFLQLLYCHDLGVQLQMGFGLVNGFMDHLRVYTPTFTKPLPRNGSDITADLTIVA